MKHEYLLRLVDQDIVKSKTLYKELTKEQFIKVCELLDIKKEDFKSWNDDYSKGR